MTKKINKEMVSGIFVVFVAVALYISTFSMESFAAVSVKPQLVPQLVAGCLFIFGIIIIIEGYIKAGKTIVVKENKNTKEDGPIARYTPTATLILIFLFIFFLESIGFIISSALYLLLQITVLSADFSARNIIKNAVIGAVGAVMIYAAFSYGLGLSLPSGILG